MTEPLPALRVVVAWSARRNLCSIISDALAELAGAEEVRPLGEESFVVNTSLAAAELRDHLRSRLAQGDAVFVADFEVWSAHGANVDATWLLRRGH